MDRVNRLTFCFTKITNVSVSFSFTLTCCPQYSGPNEFLYSVHMIHVPLYYISMILYSEKFRVLGKTYESTVLTPQVNSNIFLFSFAKLMTTCLTFKAGGFQIRHSGCMKSHVCDSIVLQCFFWGARLIVPQLEH